MDRLVFWVYKGLRALLCALPLPTVFRLGQALGLVGFYVALPYRRLALRNLEIAFPGWSEDKRVEVARAHFQTLVANLFCSLPISQYTREQVLAVADLEGLED